MTRKDYAVLAAAIKKSLGALAKKEERDTLRKVSEVIMDALDAENANFNRDKFMDAAGLNK